MFTILWPSDIYKNAEWIGSVVMAESFSSIAFIRIMTLAINSANEPCNIYHATDDKYYFLLHNYIVEFARTVHPPEYII